MNNKLQIMFDFEDNPKVVLKEKDEIAKSCFWNHHYNCDCPITWREWEEQTKRSIWEIA